METAETYTHTHTHTHTQLRRCLVFLFSAVLFISSAFSATLPSEYTELEYIELHGWTYFNTNVYLSKDMDIEFEFMPIQLNVGGGGNIMGARSVNNPGTGSTFFYNINHPTNGTNTLIDFFGSDATGANGRWHVKNNGSDYVMQNNKKYKLSITNKVGVLTADGTVIDTHTYPASGTGPITVPLYIHASDNAGNLAWSNDRIRFYHYSATGVADIVPARRNSDNVLGLYNKVNGEFLEKLGCDDGYKVLEYLTSTGTQYIEDTSFQTIDTGAIEIKTKDLGYNIRFVGFGNRADSNGNTIALATNWTSMSSYSDIPVFYGYWDDRYNNVNYTPITVFRYEFTQSSQKLYINGTLNKNLTQTRGSASGNFRLFKVSTTNNSTTGSSTIYYAKVFDGDNNLLRYYIPVRRDDGVLGMYDTVTGTFFTNQGTGTFTTDSVITDKCISDYVGFTCDGNNKKINMLGSQVCLSASRPTGSYLVTRYNGNKYYINLSEETPNNPKPITSESNNVLRIITNTATYNAHDASVSE